MLSAAVNSCYSQVECFQIIYTALKVDQYVFFVDYFAKKDLKTLSDSSVHMKV